MPHLDVRTASLALALATLVSFLLMLKLWRQARHRYPETALWAWDFGLQSLGVILISLRDTIPDLVSMWGGNAAGLTGAFLGFIALQRYTGRRRSIWPDLVAFAAFSVVQIYFAVFNDVLPARNLNVSVAISWISLRCAITVFHDAPAQIRKTAYSVGVVFSLYVISGIYRVVSGAYALTDSNDYLTSGVAQVITLLVFFSLSMVLTFEIILMYNESLAYQVSKSEERFAKAFHSSPYALLMTRARDAMILEVNDGFCAVTGFTREQAVGRTSLDLGLWPSLGIREKTVQALRAQGRLKDKEMVFRVAGGREVTGLLTADPIEIDGEPCILTSFNDITDWRRAERERSKLQTRLAQSQRLESIGTLASGVAHEINNPLNVVMNYGQMILDDASAADATKEYAASIVKESERMAGIVASLLTFSHSTSEPFSLEDLHPLLQSAVALAQPTLRRDHMQLRVSAPAELPKVACRPRQLQQVLLNLIWNARDAMAEKEGLSESEKVVEVALREVDRDGKPWLRVSVADRGVGIPPEMGERVFDPFFSTKPKDKGSGLGLSTSHGIAKAHQAELHFESTPGKGTTFFLDLPLHMDPAELSAASSQSVRAVRKK